MLLFLWVLFMPITYAYPLYRLEKRYFYNDFQTTKGIDVIVILGAGVTNSSSMMQPNITLSLLERIRFGAFLQRETSLPILVSGRGADATTSEASLMKKVLEEEFHAQVDFVEAQSRTTQENAYYSLNILREEGVKGIFLVSNSWHLKRAELLFNRYAEGVKVVPIADFFYAKKRFVLELRDFIPSLSTPYYSRRVWREYLALLSLHIKK
jgi:uncharacterized SAM-binding protein YcdF (DUF218 family)